MRIEHLALWTNRLESLKTFYERHFGAVSNERYHNPRKDFYSYFLTFPGGGPRLELMQMPNISANANDPQQQTLGLAHFAVEVGDEARVDALTAGLRADGVEIVGEPRRTGDGYYESVVLDPDGNRIELTASQKPT